MMIARALATAGRLPAAVSEQRTEMHRDVAATAGQTRDGLCRIRDCMRPVAILLTGIERRIDVTCRELSCVCCRAPGD